MQALQPKKKCAIKLSVKEWTNYLGMEAFSAGDYIFERKFKIKYCEHFLQPEQSSKFFR